jgi:hypothetical protein
MVGGWLAVAVLHGRSVTKTATASDHWHLDTADSLTICEHVFVPAYGFTLTEHDPAQPWIVRDQQHRIVELDDDEPFFEWASRKWPADRFTVQLDPWQLGTSIRPDRDQE